jgi:hypothetical protein
VRTSGRIKTRSSERKRSARWSRSLARPIGVKGGPELRTLDDARAYLLTLSAGEQNEPRWQSAARKLLEACENGEVEAVTRQLEFALFMSARLVLR